MNALTQLTRILRPVITRSLILLAALGLGIGITHANPPIRKTTRWENMTVTPIVVHAGGTVSMSAQLYYQDKQGKYRLLTYKSVPVEWRIGNSPIGVSNSQNGTASFSFTMPKTARKGLYRATAWFYGDIDHKGSYISRNFTVVVP